MKKILLSIGAIATISTPIVTTIACGEKDNEKNMFSFPIKAPTYPVEPNQKTTSIDLDFAIRSLKKATSQEEWEAAIDEAVKKDIENTYEPDLIDSMKSFVIFLSRNYQRTISISDINSAPFNGKKLPDWFALPDNLDEISQLSFYGATLNDLFSMPSGLNSIENNAFEKAILNSSLGITWKVINNYYFGENIFKDAIIPLEHKWMLNEIVPGNKIIFDEDRNDRLAKLLNDAKNKTEWENAIDQILNEYPENTYEPDLIDAIKDFVNFDSNTTISSTNIDSAPFSGKTLPNWFALPNIVTTIGEGSFGGAILNKWFSIPNSITRIDKDSFAGAKLSQGFEIPSTVKFVDPSAFSQALIPSGTQWTKDAIFPGTKVEKIIGLHTSLKEANTKESWKLAIDIAVSKDANNNHSKEVIQAMKDLIDFDNKTTISVNDSSSAPLNGLILPSWFVIPDIVTKIGEKTFAGATLNKEFKIPNTIKSIDSLAFENTALNVKFEIPSSLRVIDETAFNGAEVPKGYKWQESEVKKGNRVVIDETAMASLQEPLLNSKTKEEWVSAIDSVIATGKMKYSPELIEKIKNQTFSFYSNDDIAFGDYFSDRIFYNNDLPHWFTFPKETKFVLGPIFSYARLNDSFALSEGINEIAEQAFKGAELNSTFKIPKSVELIFSSSFEYVKIPEGYQWSTENIVPGSKLIPKQ